MVKFTLEEKTEGEKRLLCSFSGKLTTATCQEFGNDLSGKIKKLKIPVVFDLKGVDYISSAFLRICMQTSKEAGPENLTVVNICPDVKKVFKIVGFEEIMIIR